MQSEKSPMNRAPRVKSGFSNGCHLAAKARFSALQWPVVVSTSKCVPDFGAPPVGSTDNALHFVRKRRQ
jgi:hypothetical protein